MDKPDHPLKAWRLAQEPKKTLAKLAEEVGKVTPSHLSEIENWNNEPSLDLAARLHTRTGIDMKDFVKASEKVACQ